MTSEVHSPLTYKNIYRDNVRAILRKEIFRFARRSGFYPDDVPELIITGKFRLEEAGNVTTLTYEKENETTTVVVIEVEE